MQKNTKLVICHASVSKGVAKHEDKALCQVRIRCSHQVKN